MPSHRRTPISPHWCLLWPNSHHNRKENDLSINGKYKNVVSFKCDDYTVEEMNRASSKMMLNNSAFIRLANQSLIRKQMGFGVVAWSPDNTGNSGVWGVVISLTEPLCMDCQSSNRGSLRIIHIKEMPRLFWVQGDKFVYSEICANILQMFLCKQNTQYVVF